MLPTPEPPQDDTERTFLLCIREALVKQIAAIDDRLEQERRRETPIARKHARRSKHAEFFIDFRDPENARGLETMRQMLRGIGEAEE